MEVTLIAPSSVKIKGKQATFLVNPFLAKGKMQADAAINLFPQTLMPDIEGLRITLQGPGEYEVGGVKITGFGTSEKTQYYLVVDNIRILLTKSSLLKTKDVREVDMLLLDADEATDQAAIAETTARIVILFGQEAQGVYTTLGKTTESMTKYTTTKDKLPAEMEVVLLA